MSVELFLVRAGLDARRSTIGKELPALLIVLEVGHHDLIEHLLVNRRIDDRAENFDATIEVARHQIGGGNVESRLRVRQGVTGAEAINAAVFEAAPDDRLDADILR